MFIIGTAGHIDHGKSARVQALTSIDPDRLPDEKRRGMTIDLGFAYLPLSSGEVIGIVDVPGHKDLVRNVIAGEQNMLIELADGVLFEYKHYLVIKDVTVNFLKSNGTISIQNVRELLGLSRKYILPLFSRLDAEGITQRPGDDRVLA
jgi:selenocysteine-specific translation elongation factor